MNIHDRQGDVLPLRRDDLTIEKLRAEATLVSKNQCTLAEGEATGHAHRIQEAPRGGESIELFMLGTAKILHIPSTFDTVPIVHEEHGALMLEPGCHEIVQQREYRNAEIRNVVD